MQMGTRSAQSRALECIKTILRRSKDSPMPKVTFLSVSSCERDLLQREKFHGTFDAAFVACSVTHFLTDEFVKNLKKEQGSCIVVESPLFLLHLAAEVQDKFGEHLGQICSSAGMRLEEGKDAKNVVLYRSVFEE